MSSTPRVARIWANRSILWTLVRRDLRIRYARSILGYLWTLIDPLAMALVFYLVFGVIFGHKAVNGVPYIIYLLCALLPWNWFNNTINESARAIYADRQLVRSTNIPRELWVIRIVISKGIEHLLSLPILIGFIIIFMARGEVELNWRVVGVIPALVVQFLLLIGMGLVMAPVTALVDDFVRVVRIVLRVLFYLTPIVYSPLQVEEKLPWAINIISLNPLTGIAEMYRAGTAHTPTNWSLYLFAFGVSCVWVVFGMWVFRRLERPVLKEI